jgi:site-specific recombinase XerC
VVKEYTGHWWKLISQSVKPRTLARYAEILGLHILPRFENVRVSDLNRGHIRLFLADKLHTGLQRRTVRNIQAVFRAMLNAAIEDGLITSNPAA